MRARWSPEADRSEIFEFIAADNPAAAEKPNALFDRAVDRIKRFPFSAREGEVPGTRELIPHPSHRLVYAVEDEEILIVALFHAARQWPPVDDEGDR